MAIIKEYLKDSLIKFNKRIFDKHISKKNFCIFSNDCWGAEIYRKMQIPYNTPFVGLMMMAPCYIKFLKDPHKYLESKLEFISESEYEKINELRTKNRRFPVGKILDIEIHFLHYTSEKDALEKWNRRKARINWDNISVKFTMDKDYATEDHLKDFEKLPYVHKVCFSKNSYPYAKSCIQINNFVEDGVSLFSQCMKQFDIIEWINSGEIHFHYFRKFRGVLLSYSLKK